MEEFVPMKRYPTEAYAKPGSLWWQSKFWPGKKQKFGGEPKLAAWLRFNAKLGDIITLKQLRHALGDSEPNTDEHLNRRFRNLRKYGWIILSSRDDGSLQTNEYKLTKIGSPIWLGKAKFRKSGISDKTRREVFESDGHRCVICGIGANEPYPDDSARIARLTIGHVIADALEGLNDRSNLRTECSRCNEPAREAIARSNSSAEIWPNIRDLKSLDKRRLFRWMQLGQRERDKVDKLYDQYRSLPEPQRKEIRNKLEQATHSK